MVLAAGDLPIMQCRHYKQRIVRLFVVAIVLTIAAGSALTGFLGSVADKSFKEATDREAKLVVAVLNDYLDKVENATKALSQADSMIAALSSGSPVDLERANRVLDNYKSSLDMSICFLLDKDGLVIASSNRHETNPLLGISFARRPYFTGAIAGRFTTYFALGMTTNQRGYFASAPVVDSRGKITGAVVIKRNTAPLGEFFSKYGHAYLVSPDGVIFISNGKEPALNALWPVDGKKRVELQVSRQFGEIAFAALLAAEPRSGSYVRLDHREFYLKRLPIGLDGWTLVLMEQPRSVTNYQLFGILLTVLLGLLLLLFFNVLLNKDKTLDAAREMLKAKEVWKRTLDAVPDLITTVDTADRILSVNRAMAGRLGISQEEAVGRQCYQLVHGSRQSPPSSCREQPDSWSIEPATLLGKHLEGDFIVTTAPILTEDGATESIVIVMHEVSDLKRMERSLKEYAERLEFVLEGSNVGTWEWDIIGDRGHINARYHEITEYALGEVEINFAFITKTIHPDDVSSVHKQVTDHLEGVSSMYSAQYRLVTKSGKLKHVMSRGKIVRRDENGRPILMAGILTDVTDIKRLSDEVNRISSLESIGLLAGGLAHDFNNVLNIIYGNISFARMLAESDSALAGPLADAEEACERARELGISLQALAQGNSPVKVPIALGAMLEDVAGALLRGTNISHTVSAADNVLPVEADPRQIRQVFENLVANAKAALSDGGKLRIDIDNYLSDGKGEPPLGAGSYVCVTLQDDGTGIPEEILPRIFDPYFSTKDTYSQRGLGLGLPTCHAILKRHGGHITVASDFGIGTSITLYVPASQRDEG